MKELFSEAVRRYSAFKKAEYGNGKVSIDEIRDLREEFKKNRVRESMKPTRTKRVSRPTATCDSVENRRFARTSKRRPNERVTLSINESRVERPTSKVSYKRRAEIRAKMLERRSQRLQTGNPTTLKEAIEGFRAFKESKGKGTFITRDEFNYIKDAFLAKGRVNESAKKGNVEVAKLLREAARCVRMGRKALREGDVPMAQDMAVQADMAVDTAIDATDPTLGAANIDPMLTQKITDVKVAVDDLANAAGISAPVDLGANVPADIPPVAGQPVDASTAAPVQENTSRANEILNRIAERKMFLEGKGKADNPREVPDVTAGQPTGIDKMKFNAAGAETNPSQLGKVPTAEQLAKGTEKGVIRFGKDQTYTPPKGVQPVGSPKKESKSLDEIAVDRYMEKLDFKKIFSQSNGVIDAPEC